MECNEKLLNFASKTLETIHKQAAMKKNKYVQMVIDQIKNSDETMDYINLPGFIFQRNLMEELCEALKKSKYVNTIDLEDNFIDDEMAIIFFKMLKYNDSITAIFFRENLIGDSAIIVLSESLEFNKKLKHINLSNNKISDAGAHALSNILETNDTLEHINLSKNKITKEGINSILKSIKKSKSKALKSIRILGNNLSQEEMNEIMEENEIYKNYITVNYSDVMLFSKWLPLGG